MALIKCPECSNSISAYAVCCPQCGFPIVSGASPTLKHDRSTINGPQQQATAATTPRQWNLTIRGLVVCFAVAGVVLGVLGIFGKTLISNDAWDAAARSALGSAESKKMTKAEWLSKLATHYGRYAQMRIVYSWKPSEFKSLMGEPDSTQTVGDQSFWYYECADGSIQLSMNAPNLSVGVMQGQINDY
jgi:hypothetical protein